MGIVLDEAVVMDQISINGLVRKTTGSITNRVWWVDEFASWQSSLVTCGDILPFGWWLKVGREAWKGYCRTLPHGRRLRGKTLSFGKRCWVGTWIVAEAMSYQQDVEGVLSRYTLSSLIHIDPQSRDINPFLRAEEICKLIIPVVLSSDQHRPGFTAGQWWLLQQHPYPRNPGPT